MMLLVQFVTFIAELNSIVLETVHLLEKCIAYFLVIINNAYREQSPIFCFYLKNI